MNEESQRELRLTDFDYLTADPHIQMLKAALSYMQPPQQRLCSIFIKLQELNRARTLFQGEPVSAMGLTPPGGQKASWIEVLQAIKPYAGPKERDLIDMLENFQIMLQAVQSSPS